MDQQASLTYDIIEIDDSLMTGAIGRTDRRFSGKYSYTNVLM